MSKGVYKKTEAHRLAIGLALSKGEGAGYTAKHIWVYKNLGRPSKCEICGKVDKRKRFMQWANVSGKYYLNSTDWKSLCTICHKFYDGITKLTLEQAATLKKRYRAGELGKDLAKEYNISRSSVSEIINNKRRCYVNT